MTPGETSCNTPSHTDAHTRAHKHIHTNKHTLHSHTHTHIRAHTNTSTHTYIQREREREREIHTLIYQDICDGFNAERSIFFQKIKQKKEEILTQQPPGLCSSLAKREKKYQKKIKTLFGSSSSSGLCLCLPLHLAAQMCACGMQFVRGA